VETNSRIYLDYAASTPLDYRVLQMMLPYFTEAYGNPSSLHSFGQQAETALEKARETVSKALNCYPEEIIFTGCGTESDNLAIRGMAFTQRKERGANHLLISPVEHHAVSRTAEQLAKEYGFVVEYLPVDEFGMVDAKEIESYIRQDTAVVSVVYANNEIGTINPIAEIGAICRSHNIPFHTDAVQAAAHLPMDVEKDRVDLLAIGAHKFYGPKGIGALYIRRGLSLLPVITGGNQENGLRAGTQNIPYIVGLAEALKLTQIDLNQRTQRLSELRDYLVEGILTLVPNSQLTGHPTRRLPNHASFVFKGVDANSMLMQLDIAGFACSSGSACKAGIPQPSDILTAIGVPAIWALGSLRITLGRDTTREQIQNLLAFLPGVIQRSLKV
jgi:cysteine desulfurase